AFVDALFEATSKRPVPDSEAPVLPPTLLDRRVQSRPWAGPAILAAGLLLVSLVLPGLLWLLHRSQPGDKSPLAASGSTASETPKVEPKTPDSAPAVQKAPAEKPEEKAAPRKGEPKPPPALVLFAPGQVSIHAGGKQTLDVQVQRQHLTGPI